jgi:hypothetical protein
MRSVVPVAAAGQATAALVAAFLMHPVPAAAQPICGDTPVEVRVQVRQRHHAEWVARTSWSNCARKYYGDEWGSLRLAKGKSNVYCYYVGAWQRYYRNRPSVACRNYDSRPRYACFYRAIPCRYRANNGDDD